MNAVVLDARVGKIRETTPALTPWLVNEYTGVAGPPDASGGLRIYRATSRPRTTRAGRG